jgi:hypothetical protein
MIEMKMHDKPPADLYSVPREMLSVSDARTAGPLGPAKTGLAGNGAKTGQKDISTLERGWPFVKGQRPGNRWAIFVQGSPG